MKTRVITWILLLAPFCSYAQQNIKINSETIHPRQHSNTKQLQEKLLNLIELGVLSVTDQGEVIFTQKGESIIDELRDSGLLWEVYTNHKAICA